MNCRDFIKEFEARDALTEPATMHLSDCPDCRQVTVVQTQVWRVIERFEPVGAPNDFNFRVKARIAGAKPNNYQSSFSPILRYVLPFGVLGLILAFIVFNGVFTRDDNTVQIADSSFQQHKKENSPLNSATPEQIASVSEPLEVAQSTAANQKVTTISSKKNLNNYQGKTPLVAGKFTKSTDRQAAQNLIDNDKNFNRSRDNALTSEQGALPKGINPAQSVENPAAFSKVNSTTAEQILSELGIESASENGRRLVKKIKQNSVAERSDVRVGDWVEAIDGEKLTSEPIRAKTIEGKKLTVVRGAEKIEILLRN